MISKSLMAIVALMLVGFSNAEYDVAHYCQLVKPGTKLPSLDSCQNYYKCIAIGQFTEESCSSGEMFDKDKQECVVSEKCFHGENPCQNKTDKFVPNVEKCGEWYYCWEGKSINNGACPEGQILNYNDQSCEYGDCLNTDDCDIIPKDTFFADTKDCKNWYKCKDTENKNGKCVGDYVFDPLYAACTTKTPESCKRIITETNPPTEIPCEIGAIKADTLSCSIYYKCETKTDSEGLIWNKYSCENGYFDVIEEKCEIATVAKPHPNCDRCQFKSGDLYWVNKVSTTCSEYLTCSKGKQIGENSCGKGNYFNEDIQRCVIGDAMKKDYVEKHGACVNYKCDDKRICTPLPDQK